MSREVIKYKFNRNHVRIYTIQNPEGDSLRWACPRYDVHSTCRYINEIDTDRYLKQKQLSKGKNYIEIKKESTLGFYYNKREYISSSYTNRKIDESSNRTINTVSFVDADHIIHVLTFYTKYGENKSARTEDGLRPWEICEGDNNMPDHMLNALWDEVTSFFNQMEALKIDKVYMTLGFMPYDPKRDHDLYSVKKEVCEYLFGSIKGIRFQTDLEKIIAHGFDPKYSFRKDKEKK